MEGKLDRLKDGFESFLQKNNDFTRGNIIKVKDADPHPDLLSAFLQGEATKKHLTMGIMFHGTAQWSRQLICRNGMKDYSHYTSSFDYAVRRSKVKEESRTSSVEVLAMAVLVDNEGGLKSKDKCIRNPNKEYSLPLFVVTVSV